MEPNFWHERWDRGEIGFHEGVANTLLTEHFPKVDVGAAARVFLPLCGKTRDIAWLLDRGFRTAGVELSEQAVKDLFTELGMTPEIEEHDELIRYRATDIDIFVDDIFALSSARLGPIDVVYDRAALVALPPDMRLRYTAHLMEITEGAPQFVIAFEYDQQLMDGPPFSVTEDEIRRHYDDAYTVTRVETREVPGGLKGKTAASETVWSLES